MVSSRSCKALVLATARCLLASAVYAWPSVTSSRYRRVQLRSSIVPRELDIAGIYVPSLLIALIVTLPVYWLLDGVIARAGLYKWTWHVDLFRLCLFVVMF